MTQILDMIVGGQWGDEGKGKIAAEAAWRAQQLNDGKRTVVVRYQGGCNAGHTLYILIEGKLHKIVTHAAPMGIALNTDLGIGPDVAFDPVALVNEMGEHPDYSGRIMISERTGVLFGYHKLLDGWRETQRAGKIGTTGRGIGPFYVDAAMRSTHIPFAVYVSDAFPKKLEEVLQQKRMELEAAGVDVRELFRETMEEHEAVRERLASFCERLEYRLREYHENGDHIIIEGAQGAMLDRNMGTIPDVTSSQLLAPHAFATLGLRREDFTIYMVEKVYPTRVGNGPMPTYDAEFNAAVQPNAGEVGASTGRDRRCGYPDWLIVQRSAFLHDADAIIITRADNVQGLDLKAGVGYWIGGQLNDGMGGELIDEVPLDLGAVTGVFYKPDHFGWRLWEGPQDLSHPEAVDAELRDKRAAKVQGGFDALPDGLRTYLWRHDEFVGKPTMAVSIGPALNETVWRVDR